MSKLSDWLTTDERKKEFAEEELIVAVAEKIWEAMELAGTTKANLAQKLGSSKSHITQLLSGSRNMTLRSLADIAYTLGCTAQVSLQRADAVAEWAPLKGAIVQLNPAWLNPAPLNDPLKLAVWTDIKAA